MAGEQKGMWPSATGRELIGLEEGQKTDSLSLTETHLCHIFSFKMTGAE